ncbi:DUF4011 domain-containing anti-phage protein Hhe [Thermodesulfobacteriota bacterium]
MVDHHNNLAATALETLRKRLLDLTARNRLINFRHTKGASLRVVDRQPNQVVEFLLSEKEMHFLSMPEPTKDQLIEADYIKIDEITGQEIRQKKAPSAEEWARWLGLEISYDVPVSPFEELEKEYTYGTLQTLYFPYELETRLRNLRQKANSAIEETGANILYLAVGFLEWFDSTDSDKSRIAPLFLVPAQLQKGRLSQKTKTYDYTLSYSGEDLLTNLSLREKLRVDFALDLPVLDENTRPEEYLKAIEDLLKKNQPQWRLRRYITLTLLNFKKLLMYLDLDPNRWPKKKRITDHPIVTRFLVGYSGKNAESEIEPDLGFGEEYAIDELPDVHTKYPLIDDADSSQHSALIDGIEGKNLVIEGPPGTGKSQTITNLIAAAMSQGKKVLFVAEKLAALEVVKRRLDAVGLGEFCMELHSHKAQKRKVHDVIGERLEKRGRYPEPMEIDEDIARYEELKKSLKDHAERINRSWKNTGMTLHEIFMAAVRYREVLKINPDSFHPEGYDGNNFDATAKRHTKDQVQTFINVFKAVANQLGDEKSLLDHPWFGVRNTDLQIFDMDRIKEVLKKWQNSLQELMALTPNLSAVLDCSDSDIPIKLTELETLLIDLERLPKLEGDELLDSLPMLKGTMLKKAKKYIKLFEDIQRLYFSLAKKISPDVLDDLSSVDSYLRGNKQLCQLVGKDIELSMLIEAIKRLNRLLEKLVEIEEPVSKIIAAIDENAAKHLKLTESGLKELKVFLGMVSGLQPLHWKLRDSLFDNDELDQILPRMRKELETLLTMQEELIKVYSIDGLPNYVVLRDLQNILTASGALRWFKSDWRKARKRLLGYAINHSVKSKEMMVLLDKAILFAKYYHYFVQNKNYKEFLGVHVKGLDTDLASLEAVRGWYKQVRQIYGFEFGPKVTLGNAIIEMPIELARSIRSLTQGGITKQLNSILDELSSLKTVFSPIKQIQDDQALLVGTTGILKLILDSLVGALQKCRPLINDREIPLAELTKRIENLNKLRNAVGYWEKADYDNRLFKGRLGLKIGINEDNQAALRTAHRTITIADYLDQATTTPLIRHRIYALPSKETFKRLHKVGKRFREVADKQSENRSAFETLVKLDWEDWTKKCEDEITKLLERNSEALSNKQTLFNWLDYARVCGQLYSLGFNKLTDEVEKGNIDICQAKEAYYAGIYDLLAREIIRENPELSHFSGHSQEALKRQFKEYDNKLKKLQCERISWNVDQAAVPRGNMSGKVSEYTELSLLNHEMGKKKRHIPIRQLLKRASGALIGLKPCFMMGPMSVAQYIEPGQVEFDMVIMDEASQIKPEDSLGAVARGNQLIVVGDPKQLPPTRFFERVLDDDEEDPTAIEESESILDATLPLFHSRRLRWHYRSQHESLIAFSNQSFYNSNLVLFPSPFKKSEKHGIKYSRIRRGCFINRRNIEEAEVISEAVREHFRHRPNETLGVAAMSADQRDQIERSVEMLAKEDFAFQGWLEKDQLRHESLFIKNLENVQGDERDVIFISMTYGPREPGGKVFQRFGPINSNVGWRRLNVLFTRSKKRMHVFSSMGSEDIVIGPNSQRGVNALRDFLAYCETGILHHTGVGTSREPDSDFEIAVAEALRNHGFDCVAQVGVAGFFIDIAVIDPGNPGRYLMGIECDGATYHSAKSVRDRDRLRQAILERLGWCIRRIWSTDWFKNPHDELIPIIKELNNLKTEPPAEPEEEMKTETKEGDKFQEKEEEHEEFVDTFISKEIGLEDKLMRFDKEVIRKALPGILDNERLLRPAMLEAFLEYLPTSKPEFLEFIPFYLRNSINPDEGKFLGKILEIINSTLEKNHLNRSN